MNETGVLLNIFSFLKVLTDKDDLNFKEAKVKRILITAIEYIYTDGKFLHLLIIWPAVIYRNI
jgi:hypothetical protein